MDAFLSQIQPYLDQAQIAAAQLVEAAMANPTTTAAFAAVFLLLVFLRRRRRRKNQIAERIIAEHETQASSPAAAKPAPVPDATADATPDTSPSPTAAKTEAKVVRAAKPAAPTPAPTPETPAERPAPLVLETPQPRRENPAPTPIEAPTKPAPEAPPAAPTDAPKRAATGPKVIHVLRRITRASDTGHTVEQNVALSKFVPPMEDVADADLAKTIDYGIFAPDGALIAVIEDYTDTPKGTEPSRDTAKREILRQAGFPVTELLAGFTENQLAAHLNKLMGAA